jgi:hypothetical protein
LVLCYKLGRAQIEAADRAMKHAGALDTLNDLLTDLRARSDLVERRPGIFYLRGRAFLHFHEDRAGLFADLRDRSDWRRIPVNGPDERANLLAVVDETLQARSKAGP